MSEIALYNALTKLGIEPEEAKEAVTDVTSSKDMATKVDIKDMATKSDIKDMATKTDLAELKTELLEKIADAKHTMIMWVVGVGIVILMAVLLK